MPPKEATTSPSLTPPPIYRTFETLYHPAPTTAGRTGAAPDLAPILKH